MCKRITTFVVSFCILLVLSGSGFLNSQGITDEYGYNIGGNYVLSGLNNFSSYVNIPHNNIFNQPTHGTIEMWVYPYNNIPLQSLWSKGATEATSYFFGLQNQYLLFKIGTTTFVNAGGTAINNNQWSHVAVSWSSTGTNFTVSFFVNGAASGTAQNGIATWQNNADPVRIGSNQYLLGQPFNGKIDEVRFWNVVRTAALIAASRYVGLGDVAGANNNNAIVSGYNYAGLVSSWTFNNTSTVIDGIGGNNGSFVGSANAVFQDAGIPIPYNLAMYFPGGPLDFLVVNTSSIFNQTGDGTIEMWVKPLTFSKDQTLISKGATGNTITFLFGISSAGKLVFRTAGNPVASNGASLALNRWNHVLVEWQTSGSYFNVTFFLNGEQNGSTVQIPNLMPTNSDNVYIGSSQALPNTTLYGYIDDFRLWNPMLPVATIRNNIFLSTKVFATNSNLLAAYIFDANLNNLSSQSGITASFANGGTNNCRFSGYANETTAGYYPTNLINHATTINRGGTPNPFPNGFNMKLSNIQIPDNDFTGIYDTINVTTQTGTLFNIEVFLSIEHTYMGDVFVSLKAPNGTTKILLNRNGSYFDNALSFIGDAFPNLPTVSTYFPPWPFVKPIDALGSFNSTPMEGAWVIRVYDAAAGNTGILKGWGVRLNYAVNIENISSQIPEKFYMSQNYPNPFNPATNIKFDIAKSTNVKITLFDILGREVKVLANEFKTAGSYNLNFNASDLASGTYLYKIEAGDFTDVKKMVLVK